MAVSTLPNDDLSADFAAILDGVSEAVLVIDANRRILQTNDLLL